MKSYRWTSSKLSAGSLQFVLFIGAVIAVLLLTFVLLTHGHLLFQKKADIYVDLVKKTDLNLFLWLQNESPETITFSNQKAPIETVIEESYWGVFQVIKAKSSFNKTFYQKAVLAGSKLPDQNTALYLQDNNRPMVIAGKSQIIGDAYLPRQGIRIGNISGQSFFGNTPVLGRTQLSSTTIPDWNGEINAQVSQLLPNSATFQNRTSTSERSIVNSFFEPTLVINADELNLEQKKLVGNIVLQSNWEIRITASTILKDVILIAPKIFIEDGVTGNFQAIASKNISVGKNCHLFYPTALVVNDRNVVSTDKRRSLRPEPEMLIQKNSTIRGSIAYLGSNTDATYYPQILVEEGSTIIGQIYSQKNLELKGEVWGNVVTHGFMALENGNVYQNHLFNGGIDVTKLSKQYVGHVASDNSKKAIAKWLY